MARGFRRSLHRIIEQSERQHCSEVNAPQPCLTGAWRPQSTPIDPKGSRMEVLGLQEVGMGQMPGQGGQGPCAHRSTAVSCGFGVLLQAASCASRQAAGRHRPAEWR